MSATRIFIICHFK